VTPLLDSLRLGKCPRVVGTIITPEFLQALNLQPRKLGCDLVELRADGYPDLPGWVGMGTRIEEFDIPVFATIRLAREGGKWNGLDSDRWPLLETALRKLSGVDVELQSDLAQLVSALAAELNKLCVLSYHNFQETPPRDTLRRLIDQAHAFGAVGKIAATINSPADLETLRSLLAQPWPLPVCLIGMGPAGRDSRLEFPRLGSCFTYGYLDTPGAPGQFSAAELMSHFAAEPKPASGV
jgi:3-dehydroquinate dehydratase-1